MEYLLTHFPTTKSGKLKLRLHFNSSSTVSKVQELPFIKAYDGSMITEVEGAGYRIDCVLIS